MSNGSSFTNQFISFQHEDRQWDCRFNVQLDADLDRLLIACEREYNSGKLKYVLIGGLEEGTKPYQDDFKIRHVHVALIFINRVSKRAILKNLDIKEGNGYYLAPRNRALPYSGWRNHHTKTYSKIDESKLSLYEMGTLPEDRKSDIIPITKRSDEEKKRKVDEVLIDMRELIEGGQEEVAWKKYPRNYLQYGEKLKSLITQKRAKINPTGEPHIWLYGTPGSGKSAILNYIYPKYYKKNLYNKFFDLYDDKIHTHIMLEDLDHEAVDKLSTNFIKTLCDEAGFAIDQKYKTPQLTRSTILVTSNFTLPQIIHQSEEANVFGKEENLKALLRRFWHIDAREFMRVLGVKILPKYELQQLKKSGNVDPGKLFMCWDYLTDCPTGLPLPKPEELQATVKDTYYK